MDQHTLILTPEQIREMQETGQVTIALDPELRIPYGRNVALQWDTLPVHDPHGPVPIPPTPPNTIVMADGDEWHAAGRLNQRIDEVIANIQHDLHATTGINRIPDPTVFDHAALQELRQRFEQQEVVTRQARAYMQQLNTDQLEPAITTMMNREVWNQAARRNPFVENVVRGHELHARVIDELTPVPAPDPVRQRLTAEQCRRLRVIANTMNAHNLGWIDARIDGDDDFTIHDREHNENLETLILAAIHVNGGPRLVPALQALLSDLQHHFGDDLAFNNGDYDCGSHLSLYIDAANYYFILSEYLEDDDDDNESFSLEGQIPPRDTA